MDVSWLAFLGVITLLTITPGPDLLLVTRAALAGGWSAAARTMAGIAVGLWIWALAAAFGVAALVAASPAAFSVLTVAGASYLIFLGARALQAAWRRDASASEEQASPTPAMANHAFRRGLVTNLLNPKIGVFYTAFLPQFVDPDHAVAPQVLVLALVQIALGCAFMLTYAALVARAGDALRQPRVARALDAVAGTVLIAFGVRLLLAPR